jgi:CHAD domain-containing protein
VKKLYPAKKKISLKENIKNILPLMYDDFMFMSDIIINFPMRKNDLHEMRKLGKPLRYTMELGEYCFGEEFKQKLDEVKDVLELMGDIHDADVMIPDLNLHIKETRLFNITLTDNKQRFSTRVLRETVAKLRTQRREKHTQLAALLTGWKKNNFKASIIKAMD